MNLPEINPYKEQAIDIVVTVLNNAKDKFGQRQNLFQLAQSHDVFKTKYKIPLNNLKCPLPKTSEKLLVDVIEKHWKLTPTFMYIIRYIDSSEDESSHYYYFEAIFSQPTVSCPIPQATASVFFRVEDKHIEPPDLAGVPKMFYRVEGHHADHDVQSVFLPADTLLGLIKMKIKLYKRIEKINLF